MRRFKLEKNRCKRKLDNKNKGRIHYFCNTDLRKISDEYSKRKSRNKKKRR